MAACVRSTPEPDQPSDVQPLSGPERSYGSSSQPDAPVGIQVGEDSKTANPRIIGHCDYLDAAGVETLNDKLAGGV